MTGVQTCALPIYFVFPTLRLRDGELVDDEDPGSALSEGNVLFFPNAASADSFARGSWKTALPPTSFAIAEDEVKIGGTGVDISPARQSALSRVAGPAPVFDRAPLEAATIPDENPLADIGITDDMAATTPVAQMSRTQIGRAHV